MSREQDRADEEFARWDRIEQRIHAGRHYAGALESIPPVRDCAVCEDYGYAWDTLYDGTPVMVPCPSCTPEA